MCDISYVFQSYDEKNAGNFPPILTVKSLAVFTFLVAVSTSEYDLHFPV